MMRGFLSLEAAAKSALLSEDERQEICRECMHRGAVPIQHRRLILWWLLIVSGCLSCCWLLY